MIWAILYIATILAANAAIEHFGAVPVGFGLLAPAGVYFAGLAFTFRDGVHERYGARGALVAIVVGTVLSIGVNPAFALASGVAFGVSELADLLVYAPLRRQRPLLAVALSNTVGLMIDSVLFLWLAFSSLEYLPGQLVGKGWATLLAMILLALWRLRWMRTTTRSC